MPHLIVIYGPPLSGKSSLARAVADALEGKSAVVGIDAILEEAIRNRDEDAVAELEVAHVQARLLVANFLKNRYHVVLEGAFLYERGGVLHHREHEVEQLLALMRNLARSPIVVRLSASEGVLRERAQASGRPEDGATAVSIAAAYRPGGSSRATALTSDGASVVDLAAAVVDRLEGSEN